MVNKLLLLITLFSLAPALCMEQEYVAMDIDYGEIVTIQTNDGMDFQVAVDLAQLSGTIKDLIEYAGTDNAIPLSNINSATWQLIQYQLECVYNIKNNIGNVNELNLQVFAACKNLGGQELIDLIKAVNYLDVGLLLKCAIYIAKEQGIKNISPKQLAQLPKEIRNSIVFDAAFSTLGHLPGKQIAKGVCGDSVRVTPGGHRISGYTQEGNICVWDTEGKLCAQWSIEDMGYPFLCEATANNKIVICGDADNSIYVYDMDGTKCAQYNHNNETSREITVTPDDKVIAAYSNGDVCGWDIETGKLLADCDHPEEEIDKMIERVSKKNLKIINAHNKIVYVGDLSGKELAQCHGHTGDIRFIDITLDEKVVSSSSDATIRVWDISVVNKLKDADKDQIKAIWAYLKEIDAKITENMNLQLSGLEYQITDVPIIPVDCWQHIQDILDGTVEDDQSSGGQQSSAKRLKRR